MPKSKSRKKTPKPILALPDLEQGPELPAPGRRTGWISPPLGTYTDRLAGHFEAREFASVWPEACRKEANAHEPSN
jgi:hypothetical protein